MAYPDRLDAEDRSVASDEEDRAGVNLAVGWGSLAVGAITGLVLGLWSFGGPVPVPDWIGEYDTLPRRLLRLGHIAFFGLGILNIMLARHLGRHRGFSYPRRLALTSMNFGNVVLPITLVGASAFEPAKYLMSLPAMAVTLALLIAAYVAICEVGGIER